MCVARDTHSLVRIVFDTSSLITALRSSKEAAAEVLRLLLLERVVLLMGYKIASEYRDLALRPEHLAAARRSVQSVLSLIASLQGLADSVQVIDKPRSLSSDPNDDMILDVALNGQAAVIVTQNAKHFTPVARRYGVKVQSPTELLESLREKDENGD